MKRFLLPAVLLAVILSAGCSHIPFLHKKKADKPLKENPKVATTSELEFRQRWVDKRAAELVSQGLTATAAHGQAMDEFRQKFAATSAAKLP